MLKAVRELLPRENLIYLADSRYTPYGGRSTEFIGERVEAIAAFLQQNSVKSIIVACNTATAAAVNQLRQKYSYPIIGMEPALKPAVECSANSRVGVLATSATLASDKYQELKSRFCHAADIIEKASPLFVELVESAPEIKAIERSLIEKELQPFIQARVDSLVLGCTHFPFLTQTISEIMGNNVRLFESAMPVARELKRRLGDNFNRQTQPGWSRYYSSAPDKAQASFNALLSDQVSIESFAG